MLNKSQFFSICFLLVVNFCHADEELANLVVHLFDQPVENEEISQLDHLIEITKTNLTSQIALKDLIEAYQKEEAAFLENPKNKEQLFKTAKTAKRALEAIKDQHLTQVFDSKFLNGLTLFAKFANNPTIPKPS